MCPGFWVHIRLNKSSFLVILFFGNHDSSPRAVLQMITAHLQCPLQDRITHGQLVSTNYEIARDLMNLAHPEYIQPDLDCLNKAIFDAKEVVKKSAIK